eukprot:267459-Chlamydomonas_euryale.AAC.2
MPSKLPPASKPKRTQRSPPHPLPPHPLPPHPCVGPVGVGRCPCVWRPGAHDLPRCADHPSWHGTKGAVGRVRAAAGAAKPHVAQGVRTPFQPAGSAAGCTCQCVFVKLQLWTALPPLAEWIRRSQPAHTPP